MAESQIQELFCSSVKFNHKISISVTTSAVHQNVKQTCQIGQNVKKFKFDFIKNTTPLCPSVSLDALDYDEQWIGWSCTTNADSETSLTRSRSLMPLKKYVLYDLVKVEKVPKFYPNLAKISLYTSRFVLLNVS